MSDWQSIGRHRACVKDDVLVLEVHGELGSDDAVPMLALIDDIAHQHGVVHLIVDMRQGEGITPEARRLAGAWRDSHRGRGVTVLFGASMAVHAIVTLVHTALRLLGKPNNRLLFVKSEAAAWQAVARWRQDAGKAAAV